MTSRTEPQSNLPKHDENGIRDGIRTYTRRDARPAKQTASEGVVLETRENIHDTDNKEWRWDIEEYYAKRETDYSKQAVIYMNGVPVTSFFFWRAKGPGVPNGDLTKRSSSIWRMTTTFSTFNPGCQHHSSSTLRSFGSEHLGLGEAEIALHRMDSRYAYHLFTSGK